MQTNTAPEQIRPLYAVDETKKKAIKKAYIDNNGYKIGDRFYLLDNIPKKKRDNVIAKYVKINTDEEFIALYDDTIFGNAKVGFVITPNYLYFNNTDHITGLIPISCIDGIDYVDSDLLIMSGDFHTRIDMVVADDKETFARVLDDIVKILK